MSGAFNSMKSLIFLIIYMVSSVGFVPDYEISSGEQVFVPAIVPEAKIGGGDYYNLSLEVVNGTQEDVEYDIATNGVLISFIKYGLYTVKIITNHITKTTCASAHASQDFQTELNFKVYK
ncbi:MAG: hypothetical protein C0603_05365 [Denitrovibrio sp.]|nr:MAG: hypothetical protein C0603_05365 [Denitrovibrio sp.]